jgi:hypothetical protein
MFGCSQERERRDHATSIVTKSTMGEGFQHLDFCNGRLINRVLKVLVETF